MYQRNNHARVLAVCLRATRLIAAVALAIATLVTATLVAAAMNNTAHAEEVDFEKDIVPILISRCLECHGSQDPSGELDLSQLPSPSLDKDLLWQRISTGEMPPPRQGKSQKLADQELNALKLWLDHGMPWPQGRALDPFEQTTTVRAGRDWWSLQKRQVTPLPNSEQPSTLLSQTSTSNTQTIPPAPDNAIDVWIDQRLRQLAATRAPQSTKRQQIERLYFDLLGIPPTEAQIEAFLADTNDDAYQRIVDQLLASPQYGVRWGRYWLDLVRYADTSGYERDQEKPFAWKYRDWVVDALNADMPYDQFVQLQLAGDEIDKSSPQAIVATGMLRLGTWNDEPNDPSEYVYERLEDLVHVTSSTFLGMTVKCARCHDHKFDPISQIDYYRLAAVFWPGPIGARDSKWLGGPSPQELPGDILGWTDITHSPPPLRWLKSGDIRQPRDIVQPGSLSFLPGGVRPFEDAPAPETEATGTQATGTTTGRRLQLAKWLTSSENPLLARVIANRLWQFHFGEGIVRSPSNFGFTGELPTHPELLEHLSQDLEQFQWSLKRLHRTILLSQTYQQSVDHPDFARLDQLDPANRTWWRAMRRRLDAETLRDHLLGVSGQLDLRMGGAGFRPPLSADILEGLSMKSNAWIVSPRSEYARRSLYLFSQRSLGVPLMTTFDSADTTQPCPQRNVSTVAPQALAMMNNEMVHEPCNQLAKLIAHQSNMIPEQVEQAFLRVHARLPTPQEREMGVAFVRKQESRFSDESNQLTNDDTSNRSSSTASDIQSIQADLHFTAQRGLQLSADQRAMRWQDQSSNRFIALQEDSTRQPLLKIDATAPISHWLEWDGKNDFMHLERFTLDSPAFTLMAVIRDRGYVQSGAKGGHRELFSNWNGSAGNSVTSIFVGLTGDGQVRVSDDFLTPSYPVKDQWQLLSVTSSEHDVVVEINGKELARKTTALSSRNLSPPYVIGQQGSIDGEYWNGDIAEIALVGHAIDDAKRRAWIGSWLQRYKLAESEPIVIARTPREMALAALCQVLVSSNEFLYVD